MFEIMLNVLELCLKIMLYNRKFIHLQCVFHSIRLRLRLTKIGCRETINFFVPIQKTYKPLFHNKKKPEAKYQFCSRQSTPIYLTISIGHK
jgi:hypothetical protein